VRQFNSFGFKLLSFEEDEDERGIDFEFLIEEEEEVVFEILIDEFDAEFG